MNEGVFVHGVGQPMQMTVALPEAPIVFQLHTDTYFSAARLDVTIDGLEPRSTAVDLDTIAYRFVIHAKAPGATMYVSWVMTKQTDDEANIAISAATLSAE